MRRIVFLLVLCLSVISSSAQIKDIEIIAGPNMGTLRSNLVNWGTETKTTFNSKMGYSMGVGSNYFFNEKLSLGVRLLYQRTTVRGDFPFFWTHNGTYVGNLELTTFFDYISLPVRARYTVGNKIKFSGEVGGFINCLLNSSARDYFIYDPQTPNYNNINAQNAMFARATEQYTRFDAGLSLGFSSQIPLSEKLSAMLSVSDNYGFVNISTIENPLIPIRENESNYLKSNTVTLLAGVVYRIQ